jgi:hypothetical protein
MRCDRLSSAIQDGLSGLGGRVLFAYAFVLGAATVFNPAGSASSQRRTVINLANAHFRRRRLERRRAVQQPTPVDVDAGPDVATQQAVRACLLTLPIRQRTAIVLRYYEDRPERRIAEVLRCRPEQPREQSSQSDVRTATTPTADPALIGSCSRPGCLLDRRFF